MMFQIFEYEELLDLKYKIAALFNSLVGSQFYDLRTINHELQKTIITPSLIRIWKVTYPEKQLSSQNKGEELLDLQKVAIDAMFKLTGLQQEFQYSIVLGASLAKINEANPKSTFKELGIQPHDMIVVEIADSELAGWMLMEPEVKQEKKNKADDKMPMARSVK